MSTIYQSGPGQQEERTNRWVPLAIAFGFIIVIAAAIWFFGKRDTPVAQDQPDPYADQLVLSGLRMSQAENFIGGQVTYIEGKISNVGTQTVTNATVEVVFRNALGQVVQDEKTGLQVASAPLGEADFVPLKNSPLTPNGSRDFRLTFEHISADWNMGIPEVRVMKVDTKD